MIGDPSNSMPGSVVTMAGAPEAPLPRATPRAFDDPTQQRRRLALFNEIKDYARGQNYPGVSDGEISQMAAAASHKLDAMSGADRVNFAAQGDASVATLVQSTFANFLSSKTEREKEAMRQPPTSAATAGADQGKQDKGGIDPLTGLMGVERQALGGMRTAGTAGTNVDSGNSGGNARGGSAAYDTMATHSYGSPAYWASPQGITETRGFAVQNGVPWVASNPQLLRLGVPAVKILADAHLTKQNYDVLHKGVGLSDKASVGMVKYWHDRGEDANKKAPELKRDHDAIKKASPEAAREFKDATEKLGAAAYSKDPEKLKQAEAEFDRRMDEAAKKHPKAAPALRQGRDHIRKKAEKAQKAEQKAGDAEQGAGKAENKKEAAKASAAKDKASQDAGLDGLNAAANASPSTQNGNPAKRVKDARAGAATPRAVG